MESSSSSRRAVDPIVPLIAQLEEIRSYSVREFSALVVIIQFVLDRLRDFK